MNTRKECGRISVGSPAALSRILSTSRMRWAVIGRAVRRLQSRTSSARKKGEAFGVSSRPPALRYAVSQASSVERIGISRSFPPFLVKPHHGPRLGHPPVVELEPGDGPDTRPRVGQHPDDGAVPQAPEGRRVDRPKELLDLAACDLGPPALDGLILLKADGEKRVEDQDVPRHQPVAEVPEGREGLVL